MGLYVHCLACAVGLMEEYRGWEDCRGRFQMPAASWQAASSIESQRSPAPVLDSYLGGIIQGTCLGLKTQGCQDSALCRAPCPALPCLGMRFAALAAGVQIESTGGNPLPPATTVRPQQAVPLSGLTPSSPPMIASSSRRGTSQIGRRGNPDTCRQGSVKVGVAAGLQGTLKAPNPPVRAAFPLTTQAHHIPPDSPLRAASKVTAGSLAWLTLLPPASAVTFMISFAGGGGPGPGQPTQGWDMAASAWPSAPHGQTLAVFLARRAPTGTATQTLQILALPSSSSCGSHPEMRFTKSTISVRSISAIKTCKMFAIYRHVTSCL